MNGIEKEILENMIKEELEKYSSYIDPAMFSLGDLREYIIQMNKILTAPRKEKDLILADGFLESAKRNFVIAEYCYKKSFFDLAVFNLVLSVEKMLKHMCLISGLINTDDLKKIGHDPIKLVFNIYKHPSVYPLFKVLKNTSAEIRKSVETIEKLKDKEEKEKLERKIRKIKKEELSLFLKAIEKSEEAIKRNENLIKVIDQMGSYMNWNSKKIKLFITLLSKIWSLLLLHLLLYPHYFTTNYPDASIRENIIYNKNLGIVAELPKLLKKLKKDIKLLSVR